MFGKSALPQRKPFQLTAEEIARDIEAVALDSERRNHLHYCLDNKPPENKEFYRIEEFMKNSDNLESLKKTLEKAEEQTLLKLKMMTSKIQEIERTVDTYKSKT